MSDVQFYKGGQGHQITSCVFAAGACVRSDKCGGGWGCHGGTAGKQQDPKCHTQHHGAGTEVGTC